MQSDLLTRDGPLAYAWLAANLEKKLSKQQLLNASITESANAIAASSYIPPVSYDVTGAIVNSNDKTEIVSLRVTGQLLYGVVRIYSKKTRYLFDDVSTALIKLRSSFRRNDSVILPVQQTVISSINNITLRDTITDVDLLYQEPFDLGDLDFNNSSQVSTQGPSIKRRRAYPFGDSQLPNDTTSSLYDTSIEVGRGGFSRDTEMDAEENDGLDLDLNFDLPEDDIDHNDYDMPDWDDNDKSIEVGRAAADVNASFASPVVERFDIDDMLPNFDENLDIEMGDGLDFGKDADLSLSRHLPASRPRRQRAPVVYAVTSVVRTRRKKLIIDSAIELTTEEINENRQNIPQIKAPSTSKSEKDLPLSEKLQIISRLANPSNDLAQRLKDKVIDGNKRRKLESLVNSHHHNLLANDVLDDAEEGEEAVEQHDAQQFETNEDYGFDDYGGYDEPAYLDAQPEIDTEVGAESDAQVSDNEYEDAPELIEDNTSDVTDEADADEKNSNAISESTIKIADHLREMIPQEQTNEKHITFNELVEKDFASEAPLSHFSKKEATRAFFEVLVLATNDAVTVKQSSLFGDIQISTKENLYTNFV